jgi:serine/threonine-protein kinase
MAGKNRKPATLGTWLVRALIVIVIGGALGAAGGVVGVRTLEPGKPEQPDSLQVMLDSLAKGTTAKADARTTKRAADSLNAQQRIQHVIDSVEKARLLAAQPPVVDSPIVRPDAVTVPNVVGLEEGKARKQLVDAHLVVGTVEFEASTAPAGTVLRTTPAVGDAIRLNGAVALYLSNGRTP